MAGSQQRAASFWGGFLSFSLYKRQQGRVTRQVTFAAVSLAIGLGVWRLAQVLPLWLGGDASSSFGDELGLVRFLVPGLLMAAGIWLAFRIVQTPAVADFLIAVETEMTKVSWPTRDEVIRSSIVIIFMIFVLAGILAVYDLFWWFVLRALQG
ncbi:MAG: preprotein translocase subunit SecE [Planctomycetia bacterium]|jgi:preprotein translocase subunit SecE|nr:preprotein translocase subunit SecE [Planctomycetia bacterium]NDH94322.1 preprotein translocase subunit SecE [Planctomycetia bacterium]